MTQRRFVQLSTRMVAFLEAEIANTEDSQGRNPFREKAILDTANNSLGQMPDSVLFDLWNQHGIEGPHGRLAFDTEFAELLAEWGDDYDIQTLLDASEQRLATHCFASELKEGQSFEIDGPEGDGESGVRKQWERIIPGKGFKAPVGVVLADVIYGGEKQLDSFAADVVVRPHFMPRESSVGRRLPTPDEVRQGKAKDAAYDAVSRQMGQQIAAAIKGKVYVAYSAYETQDDVPINNLGEVAVQGRCIFLDEGYGGKPYQSYIVENPTWLQLCVVANDMIKKTGDKHHIFLEGVRYDKRGTDGRNDGVRVYRFSMGS